MRRVAVLGDVHGNAVALAAVLEDVRREDVDAIVWTGDLTWGWEPAATLALIGAVTTPARYVRGNAERALAELAAGTRESVTERDSWMLARHDTAALAFTGSFEPHVSVEIDGLGAVRVGHGSPRSDIECLTPETEPARLEAAAADVPERTIVSAHTHVQFDRAAGGVRNVNPGSVGMPYEGVAGRAFWAVLGPDVELRSTPYDVDAAVARVRASGDPRAEAMIELLRAPPSRAEAIEHAERVTFSD